VDRRERLDRLIGDDDSVAIAAVSVAEFRIGVFLAKEIGYVFHIFSYKFAVWRVVTKTDGAVATIVEGMDAGAGAVAAPQPMAPVVLDDAALERLAGLLRAGQQPARPAWQMSLLVTLAGALIAAATAGYFSLRGDIASLGASVRAENAALETSLRSDMAALEEGLRSDIAALAGSLRSEIAAVEGSLRSEIAAVEESLRSEIAAVEGSLRSEIAAAEGSLGSELRGFRAEFNEFALETTQRLARLEALHPHPPAQ
jgi:hypothetical protein